MQARHVYARRTKRLYRRLPSQKGSRRRLASSGVPDGNRRALIRRPGQNLTGRNYSADSRAQGIRAQWSMPSKHCFAYGTANTGGRRQAYASEPLR